MDLRGRGISAKSDRTSRPARVGGGPQSVIVVGAGIGGLATAARLGQAGMRVTVVEKSAGAGGRVHKLERDGFAFDTGATMFLMPKVFAETYAALGERMEDHLDLLRVDPSCRLHFNDGSRLDLTGDMMALQAQLESFEPGSFARALRYIAEGSEAMDIGLREFIGRDFDSFLDFFSPANLPLLFRLKALTKHFDNVSRYFRDERLRQAFSFQNMYLGVSPFDAPATYSVLQFTELADGVQYPRGGMSRVTESLQAIAQKAGVRFLFNAPVRSIDIRDNRAAGVTLESGQQLRADLVVANADLPYVYKHLLPEDPEVPRLERMQYSCSELMFCWGVRRTYPQLLQHNLFMAGDYRGSFDRIFKERSLPDQPSFYVNVPARGDPALAPQGQDGILAMVPVGHLDERHPQDWEALRHRAREAVFARLQSVGITDLRENILFEETFGPPEYHKFMNLEKGAAFGLAYSFTQIGYMRPHNQHRRYRNLYFVGASTHPGGGLPIVLTSARLTTERILRQRALARRAAAKLVPAAA